MCIYCLKKYDIRNIYVQHNGARDRMYVVARTSALGYIHRTSDTGSQTETNSQSRIEEVGELYFPAFFLSPFSPPSPSLSYPLYFPSFSFFPFP